MSVFDRISQIHSRMQSMQSQFSNVSASNFAPSVATSGPACLNTPTAQTFEQILANKNEAQAGRAFDISASIGCACYSASEQKPLDEMVKEADRRMYAYKIAHKKQRRN